EMTDVYTQTIIKIHEIAGLEPKKFIFCLRFLVVHTNQVLTRRSVSSYQTKQWLRYRIWSMRGDRCRKVLESFLYLLGGFPHGIRFSGVKTQHFDKGVVMNFAVALDLS